MAKFNQQERQEIAEIVTEVYQIMMEKEAQEITQIHGRMLETVAMIEELATRDELDVSKLADEANKRAYALAVTMAERAVGYAENNLIEIKKLISEVENGIANKKGVRIGNYWHSAPECEGWIKELIEQEKKVAKRLEDEHSRLASLKLEGRGLKLI